MSDNDDLRSRLEKESAERAKETSELRDRLDKETQDLKDRLNKEIEERKVCICICNLTVAEIKMIKRPFDCRLTETGFRQQSMKMPVRGMRQ